MAAAAVKEVKLTDLDDDLMQKFLNKMSITQQTAITRVCMRFKANVYKSTTIMFANELLEKFRNKVIAKLPKLKKICFSIEWLVRTEGGKKTDRKLRNFLEFVAAKNPKIERLIGTMGEFNGFFIEMAKKYHKNYDETKFKSLVNEKSYERLLAMFPDIKIRYRLFDLNGQLCPKTMRMRTREERLSDPNLVSLNIDTSTIDFNFNDILTMANSNLTTLSIQLNHGGIKQDYSQIFDCAAKLPLQVFSLDAIKEEQYPVPGRWVERDFGSFRKMLARNSLVDIDLRIAQDKETCMETLNCFLNCTRSNFHHFSLQSSVTDFSVSNFIYQAREQRLFPCMYIGLQGDNDTFPIAQFIQKFKPNYRKFQFKDRKTMVQMIKSCVDLIKDQPKVHFVFYANQGSKWTLSFCPFQLERGKIKFSAHLSPSHVKEYPFVQTGGITSTGLEPSEYHNASNYTRLILKNN